MQKITVITVVLLFLSPGCLETDESEKSDIVINDEVINEIDEIVEDSSNQTEEAVFEPEMIKVPQEEGCDNINPLHCMFPFPSSAFLTSDSTTETGYRVNYTEATLPGSGITKEVEIPGLNRLDGMSPSTQILTSFDEDPDLTNVANQSVIEKSLEVNHSTVLINLKTGEKVAHWVELDARTDNRGSTILYIRTLRGLDHNTAYGVGISGLKNITGDLILPSLAFQTLIDGNYTDAPDIERRSDNFEILFNSLESLGYERQNLQAAWDFHTASTESIIGGMLHMREDALIRLGDDGIGCNVTSSEDNYGDDNMSFRRIRGTITTPQYLLNPETPPSLMSRDLNGTPLFTGYSEVPFTLVIPKTLADNNISGPIVVFGHGFMGTGESTISGGARAWTQAYNVSFLATDWYGWSNSDYDTVMNMLVDPSYFEYQADRLQQAMINKISMIRTIKGVCSDISELYNNETKLVETDEVYYMGYSLGGIYGPTLIALSPDIDRGVLWVGGSGFSSMVERSTNYNQFELIFNSILGYESRNDRAILISVAQQLWDSTDPEIYLPYIVEGYGEILEPNTILTIHSANDAQVPMLSSDRATRTAGIPVISSSTRLPYDVEIIDGPITGSALVYFDGDFPGVPEANIAPPQSQHSLAHNLIAGVTEVNEMVFGFLFTGIVENTCGQICTFEADW